VVVTTSLLPKVKRRFGGSTGSLSSGSPISEQVCILAQSSFYSQNLQSFCSRSMNSLPIFNRKKPWLVVKNFIVRTLRTWNLQKKVKLLCFKSKTHLQNFALLILFLKGGFDETGAGRSVIMMQTHIKELMMNLAKAESDKQKIAEEAYR
jgi:hypothetical protein